MGSLASLTTRTACVSRAPPAEDIGDDGWELVPHSPDSPVAMSPFTFATTATPTATATATAGSSKQTTPAAATPSGGRAAAEPAGSAQKKAASPREQMEDLVVLQDLIFNALSGADAAAVDVDELNSLLTAMELANSGALNASSSSESSDDDDDDDDVINPGNIGDAGAGNDDASNADEEGDNEDDEDDDDGAEGGGPEDDGDDPGLQRRGIDATVQCACCDDPFPFGAMVQCTQGHLFCADCLAK